MTNREQRQQRCETQIRRNGCFHLTMRKSEEAWVDHAAASLQHVAAFEECFLPILSVGGRCGVFGARAEELVAAEDGWEQGEGGAYWSVFDVDEDRSFARASWSAEPISLEVAILVPLPLDDSVAVGTLKAVIRTCHDPITVSNPTAVVTEEAFKFARRSSRKGDLLWVSFRSAPTNLYLSVLGKPEVVRQWFRFAIDNAISEAWERDV